MGISSEGEAFASAVGAFHEQLVANRLEEAFGSLLLLANVEARLRDDDDENLSGMALAYREMLMSCEEKFGLGVVKALEELLASRNAAEGKPKDDNEQRLALERRAKSKSRKPTSSEARRAKLEEQNKKFMMKEQMKLQKKQEMQNMEMRKQMQREEEDLPRLQRAAELCRLVESLRLVMVKNRGSGNGEEMAAKENEEKGYDAEDLGSKAISLFSNLVCSGLNERYEIIINELKAHRELALNTDGVVNQVEALDDDPYLKALSNILLYADGLIEKLMHGEYAVASSDAMTDQESANRVNQLATSKIVQQIESKTSATVVFVLDALYKDKKVKDWEDRCMGYLDRTASLDEAQVSELDALLNGLMEAQKYCGHFTRFLSSFDVIDPEKIRGGEIAIKQIDLAGAYIKLEEAWVTYSLEKAKELANVSRDGPIQVNSIVEDTLFVVRKAFARAVHTESKDACCSAADRICRLLENEYSEAVLFLLKGKPIPGSEEERLLSLQEDDQAGSGDEVDTEDLFTAALESDLKGQGSLSSRLLVAVNTVELSAAYLPGLIWEIHCQFEQRFPDKVAMVEMTMEGLQAASKEHGKFRMAAIEEIVESCFKPSIKHSLNENATRTTYELDNTTFEQYEREDPFVTKFLNDLVNSRNFKRCQAFLSKSNFAVIMAGVSKLIAEEWEKFILAHNFFNDLGALRFDQDLRNMISCLGERYYSPEELLEIQASNYSWGGVEANEDEEEDPDRTAFLQQLTSHFSRLKQISFLLNLEQVVHVEKIPYTSPVLSARDVRLVLSRKLLGDQQIDIESLDVSKHIRPGSEEIEEARPPTPPQQAETSMRQGFRGLWG